MDKNQLPNAKDEKQRYDKHENNPADVGYRNFVMPLLNTIGQHMPKGSKGLDFGSGSLSSIADLLQGHDYRLQQYDPFYKPDHDLLKTQYDFIVC